MPYDIDKLAEEIVALDASKQEELFDRVAEMNFRRGLEALSQKYRERLSQKGALNQKAEEVMADLARLRQEIAADEYPA